MSHYLYNTSLFVHFFGLIALHAGFAIYHRAVLRLRISDTVTEDRVWLDLLMVTRAMFMGGAPMLLATGLIMTGIKWRQPTGWITTALVGLVAIWILTFVANRPLRSYMLSTAHTIRSDGPMPADLRQLLAAPSRSILMWSANAMALAIIWLMIAKPGWIISPVILVALAIAGAIVGRRFAANPVKR